MNITHQNFHDNIDQLAHVQKCHVCEESYVRIHVVKTYTYTQCQ